MIGEQRSALPSPTCPQCGLLPHMIRATPAPPPLERFEARVYECRACGFISTDAVATPPGKGEKLLNQLAQDGTSMTQGERS